MRKRITIGTLVLLAALPGGVAFAAPPTNDTFDTAATIGALPAHFEVDTTEATDPMDDPDPSCKNIGASVWFRFTAGQDMMLGLSTDGSGFDTVLAVWRGGSEDELDEVHCNDVVYGWEEASLTVGVHAGETVHIQAGGDSYDDLPMSGATGLLVLDAEASDTPVRFRPPPNDHRADATRVTSLPFTEDIESDAATLETGEPACPSDPLTPEAAGTVWYSFSAATAMPITVSAWGSEQDVYLAVYESWDGELFPVRCEYDTTTYDGHVGFLLSARGGTEYLIQVGTYNFTSFGFADTTRFALDYADYADLLVRDLNVDSVEYQTDTGPVLDPTAREIRFTLDRTSGPYLYGAWTVQACPGPATHTVGGCTLVREGGAGSYAAQDVEIRWNAPAAGRVTIVVTVSSDWLADPDPSNDSARAETTFGPISDVGVVIA